MLNRSNDYIAQAVFYRGNYMSPEKKTRISENLDGDPNCLAYQEALKAGRFESLETGTYVAYHEGQFVGSGMDSGKLIQELHERGIEGSLVHQIGVKFHLPSPRIVVGK